MTRLSSRVIRRFRRQTVRVRTASIVTVFGLVTLVACSSDGDQTAVPPPSPDVTEASTEAPATDTTVPETTVPATSVPETTVPEATAPETTAVATTVPQRTPPTTAAAPARPTIDDLLSSGEVLNIAHAGGDQEWPHSTFYAFDQAVAAGADVLEMDVQLTGDGVLIVQHDDTVDKTTNATGRVDSFTFDEIAELDAGYWFADGCWPCRDLPDDEYRYRGVRTGEVPPPDGASADDFRIISFAEAVERYPEHAFDVEIKGTAEAATATSDALAAAIDELGIIENVVVVSFDGPTIDYFRSIAPGVEVSPGVAEMTAWLLDGVELDPAFRIVQVPPMFGDVPVITPEFWDAVGEAGVHVWMWPNDASTQENAEFYQEMIDQGVTGIIAGRPTAVPA